jgi:hypothetical protein
MSTNGNNPREEAKRREWMQEQDHSRRQRSSALGTAQQAEAQRLGKLSPDVIDKLTEVDIRDGPRSAEIDATVSPFLHADTVLSNFDDRDIWDKTWGSKRLETRLRMAYPHPERRTDNRRVRSALKRIHGNERAPLKPRDKERLSALTERKRDRARRAARGQFLDLLLREGVDIRESSTREQETGTSSIRDMLGLGGD